VGRAARTGRIAGVQRSTEKLVLAHGGFGLADDAKPFVGLSMRFSPRAILASRPRLGRARLGERLHIRSRQ
jgi:hypothetical protein